LQRTPRAFAQFARSNGALAAAPRQIAASPPEDGARNLAYAVLAKARYRFRKRALQGGLVVKAISATVLCANGFHLE